MISCRYEAKIVTLQGRGVTKAPNDVEAISDEDIQVLVGSRLRPAHSETGEHTRPSGNDLDLDAQEDLDKLFEPMPKQMQLIKPKKGRARTTSRKSNGRKRKLTVEEEETRRKRRKLNLQTSFLQQGHR